MTTEQTETPHAAPTAGSVAGAEAIRPHVRHLGLRVMELLEIAGGTGHTNGEFSALLKARDVSVWPRVSALKARGKLKDSGRTRPSPLTGTAMTVWVLTTPEEEAAILTDKRREESPITEAPGPEALHAAALILEARDSGPMFWATGPVALIVQRAIQDHSARIAKADRKRDRLKEVRRGRS